MGVTTGVGVIAGVGVIMGVGVPKGIEVTAAMVAWLAWEQAARIEPIMSRSVAVVVFVVFIVWFDYCIM